MGVRHTRNDTCSEQSTQIEGFRLEDIHHLVLQQFGELLLAGKAFAGGDRHRAAAGHLDHGRNVGVGHWFLKPCRPELMDRF